MKRILCLSLLLSYAWPSLAKNFSMDDTQTLYESYALEAKYKYKEAAEKITPLYNIDKEDYFLNMRMGYLLSYAKSYRNAELHYQKAAHAAKYSIEPWLALSLLYTNLGLYDKVITSCNEIFKRDVGNYYGMLRMNGALIQLKRFDEAYGKVEKALQRYPLDPGFMEQEGYILMHKGQTAKAREVLKFLLILSPQNVYAKSVLKS